MPVTISHAKSDTVADWTGTVTVGNSSGGTTTMQATDQVRPSDWNSAHAATLQITGSEVAPLFDFLNGLTSTTDANGVTAGLGPIAWFEPFPLPNTNSTLSAPGIGTWYFDGPYDIDNGLPKGQFYMPVSNASAFLNGAVYSAANTGSVTKYQSLYNNIAIYKLGAGASTTRLESVWTGSAAFFATQNFAVSSTATSDVRATHNLTLSFPSQFDASGGVTYGSTTTGGSSFTGSSTMVSTAIDSMVSAANRYVSGARMDIIPFNSTLPPGAYWFAHNFFSTSSTTGTNYGGGTMFSTQSRLGLLENNMAAYKRLGASTSNATTGVIPFHGYLATTSSAASSIINTSDIRFTTGRAYWYFAQSTY